MELVTINEITQIMNWIDGLSAVVFDLDDTLYSEKEYVRSGYKAVAQVIPQVADAEKKLWVAFEDGKPAIDTVLTEEDIYSEKLKEKCLEAYRNHRPEIKLYDGVADMLKKLHEKGIAVGIITDGRPEGQHAKIETLGLKTLVDKVIITDELGGIEYRKPCGKAFHLMCNMIGNGGYTTMCYVGDNINKDFKAPKELEMKCIWFRNKDGLYYKELSII